MLKRFLKVGKVYINYLTSIKFGELFKNFLILVALMALATLVYIPMGVIEDLIRSWILVVSTFDGISAEIFACVFKTLSFVSALIIFVILFVKEFEDLEAFKKRINGLDEEPQANKKITNKDTSKKKSNLEIELPKAKDSK